MYTTLGDDPIQQVAIRAVQDRTTLAQLRNAAGIPDSFNVGDVISTYKADPSDPGSPGPMIVQEILGQTIQPFQTARHTVKRADYMNAISKMESAIAQLQGAGNTAAAAAAAAASQPSSGQTIATPTPAPTPLPYITTPSPSVTTPAYTSLPAIATQLPAQLAPLTSTAPAPSSVSVTTTTTPAAATTDLTAQLESYLPYIIGGGILLFAISKMGNKTKRAA
jgi:hypothetical protein